MQEVVVHVIYTLITSFPFSIQRHYDSVSFFFLCCKIYYIINSCVYS